ncbi:MAG: exo-alpha-sialidase [Firmicutes bacterium]|nr:exo-alpha-sialidase [Bacillota bacterium]
MARTSGGAKAPIELRNGDLLAARTESWAKDFLVVCYKSVDGGESWRRLSIIASDDDPFADIGDGHFLVQYVKNGYYFCCKRGVLRLGRS